MLSGTIKNCKVKQATIKAEPHSIYKGYAGGIAASMASGTIENCTLDENTIITAVSEITRGTYGDHMLADVYAGGIVGFIDKVTGVLNKGSVNSNDCRAQIEGKTGTIKLVVVGGIVSVINDSNIEIKNNNYNGDISGTSGNTSAPPRIGGIIGEMGVSSPTISGNTFSGASYGIGFDSSGNPSNEGCTKVGGSGTATGTGTTGNGTGITTNNDNGTIGSSGGGGGCNMGFGLLLLGTLLIFRRK